MMYAVRWLDETRTALHDLWDRATPKDRIRITDAYEEITRKLRDEPEQQGESREPGFRVAYQSPLGVRFHIEMETEIVYVTLVWRIN